MNDPQPIQKSLERFFSNLGSPPIHVVSSLSEKWEDLVGPALAKVTEPVSVRDGVLTISCSDSAYVAQVQWMETQLIEAYEAEFAPNKIESIKTRLTSI